MINAKICRIAVFAAATAFALSPIHAHENACKADMEKFCKDVQPGGGRIVKCLKEHESELSDSCKQQGRMFKEKMGHFMSQAKAACQADMDKLCKGVPPGGGRLMKCLHDHSSDLSDPCKDFMAKAKEHHEKMMGKMQNFKQSCGADIQKLCNGTKPGGGRIVGCLKQHEADLSSACGAMVNKSNQPGSPAPAGNSGNNSKDSSNSDKSDDNQEGDSDNP